MKSERTIDEIRLSPSGLDKLSCPKRWRFYYVEQRADDAGPAAVIGTFVHSCYEAFYELPNKERDLEALREIATAQWPEFLLDYNELNEIEEPLDEIGQSHLKLEIWQHMQKLWDIEEPKEVDVDHVEIKVEAEFEGFPFIGFVDRLTRTDSGLIIHDYKFGKSPNPNYMSPKLMQLLLYSWALKQMGIETQRAELLFIKSRMTIGIDLNSKTDDKVKKYLEKSVGKIRGYFEVEEFPAKTSPLCGWCPYIADCAEGEKEIMAMRKFNRIRKDAPSFGILELRDKGKPESEEEIAKLFRDLS